MSRVVIYNRNDGSNPSILTLRLSNSVVSLINYQGNTLKTYRIGDATNVPVFEINFDSYLGCYADLNPNRNLPHWAADNINPNGSIECAALCKAAGFKLAGTQFSQYCFCGDSLNGAQPVPNNECNMQCLGNAAEMCGGPARNSVYIVASFSICDLMFCNDNKYETLDVCFPEVFGSYSAGCNFIGECHTRLQFMFVFHVLLLTC